MFMCSACVSRVLHRLGSSGLQRQPACRYVSFTRGSAPASPAVTVAERGRSRARRTCVREIAKRHAHIHTGAVPRSACETTPRLPSLLFGMPRQRDTQGCHPSPRPPRPRPQPPTHPPGLRNWFLRVMSQRNRRDSQGSLTPLSSEYIFTRRRGANTAHTQMGRPTHEAPTRENTRKHTQTQTNTQSTSYRDVYTH